MPVVPTSPLNDACRPPKPLRPARSTGLRRPPLPIHRSRAPRRRADRNRAAAGGVLLTGRPDPKRSGDTGAVADLYLRLRTTPTPPDEICSCSHAPPVKLMWALSPNPIHCLDCNLEVEPAALPVPHELVDLVADWCSVDGAIERLELHSGPYEAWARAELLDPRSPVNQEGFRVREALDPVRTCYLWLFQPESDDGYVPPADCPVCHQPLAQYDKGIFPQLLCERCSIAVSGPATTESNPD